MGQPNGTVLASSKIAGWGSAPTPLPPGLLVHPFNIVLVAEAFTALEQPGFDAACDEFVNVLKTTSPFDAPTAPVNVYRINISSLDSTHTYFDSNLVSRHDMTIDWGLALRTASDYVPDFDVVLIVVNHPWKFGAASGIGSKVCFYTTGGGPRTALHEIGHAAFGLADEYVLDDDIRPTPPKTYGHHPAYEPAEPNITTITDRRYLKWGMLISAETELPTMPETDCIQVIVRDSPVPEGIVGLFEGAHLYRCGVYRPEFQCLMRDEQFPFCTVCRRAIQIYLENIHVVFDVERWRHWMETLPFPWPGEIPRPGPIELPRILFEGRLYRWRNRVEPRLLDWLDQFESLITNKPG